MTERQPEGSSEFVFEFIQVPPFKALAVRAELTADKSGTRAAWRELVERIPLSDERLAEGPLAYVFIPQHQWSGQVNTLWVGLAVREYGDVPDGVERLEAGGRLCASIRVRGDEAHMRRAYDEIFKSLEHSPDYELDRSEGVHGLETVPFEPYNALTVPYESIDTFHFTMLYPVRRKEAQVTNVPFIRSIASVFLHVEDLRRSAEWYNKLLGLPMREDRFNGGPVYWYDLPDTHLILDNNAGNEAKSDWSEAMKPRLMFKTTDIDLAYAYVNELGKPLFSPERHGNAMAYFNFRDPEGNVQMACWTSASDEEIIEPISASPIQARIGAAFVDVKNMLALVDWYAGLLGISLEAHSSHDSIVSLPVSRGARLLLDGNRHAQAHTYTIPLMFPTDDLEAALSYVKENGFELFGEPEHYGDVSFFVLRDPDDNLIMVCQDRAAVSFKK